MQFINAQTGWITLYNPFNFLKTTNGGKIWNTLYPNSSQFIFFDFIDNSIGYAIGYDAMFNGLISKTNNGGLNWITVYTGARGFTALDFVNQDTGWFGAFLGDDVQILRTTNGGQTLELQYSYMSAGQGINEVFFVDKPYDGYFYGWFLNNGFMSKTTNSGFTWSTPVDSVNGLPGDYYWLFFLEKDTGWVVFEPNLNNVKIYKTQNGGTNWVEQINSDGFAEVRFINQSVGWAGSESICLVGWIRFL
ncbi:MAG: hypothetical protein P0116_16555 [Candidatus Nitrosocosmicus sp.]|nr:hypothetical protein [Candidatus Nitrosocosmicus sp.]